MEGESNITPPPDEPRLSREKNPGWFGFYIGDEILPSPY